MVDRIQDDKAIFMLHSLRLLYGERNLCMPTRVPCMIFLKDHQNGFSSKDSSVLQMLRVQSSHIMN
ncbi:hypothetical protein EE612_009777 [Oryza sativa]|nr:hypothetical protein EE612_009777 [Oryza sativa]